MKLYGVWTKVQWIQTYETAAYRMNWKVWYVDRSVPALSAFNFLMEHTPSSEVKHAGCTKRQLSAVSAASSFTRENF